MKCLRQVNFIEKGGLFSSQVGLGTQGYDASISQALVRTPWWAASQWQVPVGGRDHVLKYEVSEHQGSGSVRMTCHTESSGFPENGQH